MSDSLSDLLPQTGPARLIVDLLDSGDGRSVYRALIPPNSPFRARTPEGELVPAYLTLEMGAQAAAALVGVHARTGQADRRPSEGLIVGVRNAVFLRDTLSADASFHVRTHEVHAAPPLRMYAFEVSVEGETVATGEISTYVDTSG